MSRRYRIPSRRESILHHAEELGIYSSDMTVIRSKAWKAYIDAFDRRDRAKKHLAMNLFEEVDEFRKVSGEIS